MSKEFSKVTVLGLGYIGLPTAAMFASRGLEVVGVDVDSEVVSSVNSGRVHIVEPGLDELVTRLVQENKLRASTAVEESDAFVIAVPTPVTKDTLKPDISFVEAAVDSIAGVIKRGDLVVLESTLPVGCTELMSSRLAASRPDLALAQHGVEQPDISIAHCPERVLPGDILRELVNNDRVIGGMTPHCSALATALYHTFVEGVCYQLSGPKAAEMVKLTENSFRDINLAFANELSMICDELSVNVSELITAANRHPRVNILTPGAGVGGHCIAVDPWFLVDAAPETSRVIRAAREVNNKKPEFVISKVLEACDALKSLGKQKIEIVCFGISFKPNIDDLRNSPALQIANRLASFSWINLTIVEPNIAALPNELSTSTLISHEALAPADIALGLVPHREFLALGEEVRACSVVIDVANVWTPAEI